MSPLLVTCSLCDAAPGSPCRTASGRETPSVHSIRSRDLTSKRRGGFVAEVLATDETLGIKAGEHYWVVPYWLDPGKVTLVRRLPDGHAPECNQYTHQVRFLAWEESPRWSSLELAAALSPAEFVEFAAWMDGMTDRGFNVTREHETLRPGVRIRHAHAQYPAAYANGTGTILLVMRRPVPSRPDDVEMLVQRDKSLSGASRLSFVAPRHVEVMGAQA